MNERKQAQSPKKTATGVFDVNKKVSAHTDTNLYTVEGKANRTVSERTLKKRLAKLASSRLCMLLALFVSFSAILTPFRGYFWPVTLVLTVERVLLAVGLWMLYGTAGKKGGKLLAAIPLGMTVTSVLGLLVFAAFIACAMFGELMLFRTAGAVKLVRMIYAAELWALVPVLACIAAAYCVYLFYRHERLLLCNLRDGLRYGFAFENGYDHFSKNCIIVAALSLAAQFVRLFFTSFSQIGFLPEHAARMFDALFLKQFNYVFSLAGIMVHAAVLVVAAVLAMRYGTVVKKYKAQKRSDENAKRSAEESAAEVVAIEKEKAQNRAEKAMDAEPAVDNAKQKQKQGEKN